MSSNELQVSDLQHNHLPGCISFIGHSMGGLIIRRALQEECMKRYLCYVHPNRPISNISFFDATKSPIRYIPRYRVFISLASPHIGTTYAESQLVSSGQWVIMKWTKGLSLRELSLEDAGADGDLEKTFIFRLSQNGVIGMCSTYTPLSLPTPNPSLLALNH